MKGRNRAWWLGLVGLWVAGCGGELPSTAVGASAGDDAGDFVLSYWDPDSTEYQLVYDTLTTVGFYDDVVADLNAQFALPQDIAVVFAECGEENAFYDPELVEVTVCYDLILAYAEIFHELYQEDFDSEVIYASYFTFLHEVGHALVDQLDLPIVGREEDVVDAFATILLLQGGEEDAAIAGIEQFEVDAEDEAELDDIPYWGEHSLSDQRVYNVACLVYGSDPEFYSDWVEDGFLPEERAEGCEDEYLQAAESWDVLLAPHLQP